MTIEYAFPHPVDWTLAGKEIPSSTGMTLRDYFAAKIMAQLAVYEGGTWQTLAGNAYRAADAMLAERIKEFV